MNYQTIIAILIVIFATIRYFHEYYQRHLLKEKIKELKDRMQIPYDDYARYQKAYVEYYKWLVSFSPDKLAHSKSTIKLCLKKFKEYFKEK